MVLSRYWCKCSRNQRLRRVGVSDWDVLTVLSPLFQPLITNAFAFSTDQRLILTLPNTFVRS